MNILGIFGGYHNPGACLIIDGKLVAFIEEEKLSRKKMDSHIYPIKAIKWALKDAGLTMKDVDRIAFPWHPWKNLTSIPWIGVKEFFKKFLSGSTSSNIDIPSKIPGGLHYLNTLLSGTAIENRRQIYSTIRYSGIMDPLPEIDFIPHHKSHAASCFYASDFDKSLIIVMDGMGDDMSTSLWLGEGKQLKCIHEIGFPNSLGEFYGAFTEFLGFKPYCDEGKLMGLAAFGEYDGTLVQKIEKNILKTKRGSYKLNTLYTLNGSHNFGTQYTDRLIDLFGFPRIPESEITKFHFNLAFAAQHVLEKAAMEILGYYIEKTGVKNICVSGGVAMNCKMNGRLLHELPIDNIFINPASNDAGSAMGAAMVASLEHGDDPRFKMDHAYFGPGFNNDQVESVLKEAKVKYRKSPNIAEDVSSFLVDEKIIAWHQGRMEVGARALGARSILASPLRREMLDKVNKEVKHREPWRPFAPAMPIDNASEYYSLGKPSPFMILAFEVLSDKRTKIPAVTHVDNSCRPQTVSRNANKKYYDTIKTFGAKTGTPVVLNTSLNVRGEPIVASPSDSLRCFFSTGLDVLAIEDFIIEKNRQ